MEGYITLCDFIHFCQGQRKIKLSDREKEKLILARQNLERNATNQAIYGFNTGIGPFWNRCILPEEQENFQESLLLQHAVGSGNFMEVEEVRGMMFLLINMLSKGYSGISLETLEQLMTLFNRDIIPAIPDHGSVGASGDLAPLAHLALVLMGQGSVLVDGRPVPAKYAFDFERGHIKPIKLKAGEAIALINGTHFMASILGLTVWRSRTLSKTADIAGALTILALNGDAKYFDYEVQWLRPHSGQVTVAENLKLLLGEYCPPSRTLQTAYSLRCLPQIHGPVREVISYVEEIVVKEINSVTGNPCIVNDRIIHCGNFHGQNLSMAADFLGIGLTTLANVSERRIERLLNSYLSGLSPFLSLNPGQDSGLMIAQYLAADFCSENKVLSHPASVDSIPVAGGQEDFVSMGAGGVRKLKKIYTNAVRVIGIELLCTTRALEQQKHRRHVRSHKLLKLCGAIQQRLSFNQKRPLAEEIEKMSELVGNGTILAEAEAIFGKLE